MIFTYCTYNSHLPVIQENIKNVIHDQVWEDGIDKEGESTIWKILRILAKFFFCGLFFTTILAACLVSKFSLLELGKVKYSFYDTATNLRYDTTPLLPLCICILSAEGVAFIFNLFNYFFKKDTARTEIDYKLLTRLMISEILDLIGQAVFVLYVMLHLRINVLIFSMSTIYIIPLLVKIIAPNTKARLIGWRAITYEVMLWVAFLINLAMLIGVIVIVILDVNWYSAVALLTSILCMSQRLYWNYLPVANQASNSWWSVTSELEYYRNRFTFYTSFVRTVLVLLVTIIVSIIDFNKGEYLFSQRNEILSTSITFLTWFDIQVYWVMILQIISGYLASFIAYQAATTRMKRFSLALPSWLVQVLSLILMLIYCRENGDSANYYCNSSLNVDLNNLNSFNDFDNSNNSNNLTNFNTTTQIQFITTSNQNLDQLDLLPNINATSFLVISILWIIATIYISIISNTHAWSENKPLMRFNHLFSYNIYSSATGMMENLILKNLKSDVVMPSDTLVGRVLYQIHNAFLKDSFIKTVTEGKYNPATQDRLSKINNEKAFAKYKRPFIFANPTLYHETDYEMKQLFISCLRLNKNQIESQIKDYLYGKVDSNSDQKDYQPYDIEFNVFFDRPFIEKKEESTKSDQGSASEYTFGPKKLGPNEFVKQLHRIMQEGTKAVLFTEKIFCVNEEDEYDDINGEKIKSTPILELPVITETPYGLQLTYLLPMPNSFLKDIGIIKPNIFRVHLKDPEKIQAGKRFSQCLYLFWQLGFRSNKFQLDLPSEVVTDKLKTSTEKETTQNIYTDDREYFILALDGDVDFQPKALTTLLNRMARSPKNGAACGRIYPLGYGPVYWFQVWEYAIGHWLQKATEDVLGSVLCSPGCFSLIRADSLIHDVDSKPNSIITKYMQRPKTALEWIQWNMGEDRWMCTLLLERGWRIEYVALSDALTYAPTDFNEFFEQRRRWGPSTVFNIYDLISNSKRTRGLNDSISIFYILYQFVLQVSSFLALSTVAMIIQGSFEFVFGWNSDLALGISLLPILFFIAICFYTTKDTQLFWVNILTIMYFIIMLIVFIAIIVSMFEAYGLCNLSNQFTIAIYAIYIITGLLHIKESHPFKSTLYTLVIYSLLTPTAFILLNIYQFIKDPPLEGV